MIGKGFVPIRGKAVMQMPNGERKPYILQAQEERYRLIGEYYTHGLMKGEVWKLNSAFFADFRII